MKEILNIVICYDNADEIVEYANMIAKQRMSDRLSLIVVVNKLTDPPNIFLKRVKELALDVDVLFPGKNLGYMNGLLFGYSHAHDNKNPLPRWIIMSNTDILMQQSDFLQILCTTNYSDDIWCIGPSVYSPNRKSYENPVSLSRRSKQDIKRLIKIFRTPILNEIYIYLSDIKARIKREKKKSSQFVYEVHGCFFIISASFAEYLKDKEYHAFMYSEESFVSEMVLRENKKIYYESNLEVIHKEHSVTNRLGRKKIAAHIADSLSVIIDEFY